MIQQLLSSTQKLPAPYLAENKLIEMPAKAQSFRALAQQASQQLAPAQQLQSVSQQLQISVQNSAKGLDQQAHKHYSQASKQMANQLSQTTQVNLLKHPVQTRVLELNLQELLLLSVLRGKGKSQQAEQLVPSQFAMLSSLPTERYYLRTLPKKRKLSVSGRYFMHFRFVWEEEYDESSKRPSKKEPPILPEIDSETDAARA